MRPERLSHRQATQVLLAILGNVVPLSIAAVAQRHHLLFYIGAVASCCVAGLVTALPATTVQPRRAIALAGLPCLTLTQAYTGGTSSFYCLLMLLPMIWFGLQANDRDLFCALLVLAGCVVVPMLAVGPPAYPVNWGDGALLLLIAISVAVSIRLASRETTKVADDLRRQAITDPLTGLLNRRGWELAAETIYAQSTRDARPVTAAALDLDAFKAINDRLGHGGGDHVLRRTSDRLRTCLRAGDLLARSGGDEFIALLMDTDKTAAHHTFARLHAQTPDTERISIGIAQATPGEALADVLRRADAALYDAKRSRDGTDQPQIVPTAA